MTQPDQAVRHFIYPLSLTGGYTFNDGREIRPENLVPDALGGLTDTWGLATNYRIIEPGDWIWAYFGGSVRQIHTVGTVTEPVGYDDDWGRHTVSIRWNAALTRELQQRPIRYEDYRQSVPGAAARANATTTSVLEQWLQGVSSGPMPGVSRVPREVLQRLGQGAFRAEALRLFGGACAITGVAEAGVLQAAHIVPVADGGTHAASNTLLLRADLHNLFDLGRITVTKTLKLRVATAVTDSVYRDLDGARVKAPSTVDRSAFIAALQKHAARWSS